MLEKEIPWDIVRKRHEVDSVVIPKHTRVFLSEQRALAPKNAREYHGGVHELQDREVVNLWQRPRGKMFEKAHASWVLRNRLKVKAFSSPKNRLAPKDVVGARQEEWRP